MNVVAQQLLQRHGLTALIGVLVIGLLAAIGYETGWGSGLRPAPAVARSEAAKTADTSLLPAFGLPPLDVAFKETAERPLFLPTRRPVPVATGSTAPAMVKGRFRLAGTVLNQDLPIVFLVEIATGKGMRVAKGAEIVSTGITVASVDGSRVVLKQGEETEELTLRTAASPPVQQQPVGAPGVAVPGPTLKPPPSGVVVGAIPSIPGVNPAPPNLMVPQPGMAVLPGFVQSPQSPPGAAPGTVPVAPTDSPAGNLRRRRFQNLPQQ